MRHIPLGSIFLGLDDLLTKRVAALESFDAGKASVKLLTNQRAKIDALPTALTGLPHADELADADDRHDGIGSAIWFITEAYIRHPDTTPEMLGAAKKIREVFIPSLDALGATYEVEAKTAKDNQGEVAALTNALMLFPVAGGTLLTWVQSFLAAGESLDTFLSKRADAKDRKIAAQLRTEAMGTLTRLRKTLKVEQKNDPSLAADLDDQVFGYFDLLEDKAADAAVAKKLANAKKQAPPAPPPAPPVPPVP